jgi:thiol-disulfide isomerase/thioredoxin
MRQVRVISCIAIGMFTAVMIASEQGQRNQPIDMSIGRTIPDFEFVDFDGQSRRLSEFRGKHVLLDFWGTWCSSCVADFPHLMRIYRRFQARGFEIIGLDFEQRATTEEVRPFLRLKRVTWTNATAESVKDLILNRFRVTSFPTFVLLDPNHVVISDGRSGLRTTLEHALRNLLAKPKDLRRTQEPKNPRTKNPGTSGT